MLEASRLMIPAVQRWYLSSFKGLIREKEINKAAGIAFFLPGALAAMLAGPSNIANMGILFLSIGDAAASIGTAAGYIPVGSSPRKVEGSIGCFVVCSAIGIWLGLEPTVALTASALVSFGEVLAEVRSKHLFTQDRNVQCLPAVFACLLPCGLVGALTICTFTGYWIG
jgi:dolichol kinase